MTTETQARPLFAARLTPHRSLSPRGIRIVVAVLAGMALLPGVIFALLGAWPVIAFMAMGIVALYFALSYSFRDGRRFEQVTLWRDVLEVRQVGPGGETTQDRFVPAEVRLVVERDFDERTTGIKLRTPERELPLGAFLNPDDKSSFAKAFGTALRKARA
jgi:uncharacterized membrane protein